MPNDGIEIVWLGGAVPVQGEGTLAGVPFYFRARGSAWSLSVGGEDPVRSPDWRWEEPWGTWPSAGYMPHDEAERLLRAAAAAYLAGERPGTGRETPDAEPWDVTDADAAELLGIPAEAVHWHVDRLIAYVVWRGDRLRKRGDVLGFRNWVPAVLDLVRDGHDAPFAWPPPPEGSIEIAAQIRGLAHEGRDLAEVWREILGSERDRGAEDRARRRRPVGGQP